MSYLLLKYLHLVSMVMLFGVGLGSAYYKWLADKSNNLPHIAKNNQHVVTADWVFTTPAIIIQPLSGILLAGWSGWALDSAWIVASLVLYILAGCCWIPVVWLQLRMRDLSLLALADKQPLPALYRQYARRWFWLGIPAFISMFLIMFLMIFKPAFGGY